MDYIKKELKSYNLHMIKVDKFKTTSIEVVFGNIIKKENITINNFLSSILTYTSKKYNTKVKYARKIEDLYAAMISSNTYRVGNILNIDFNLKVLDDKYTEDGLFKNALEFLYETIFNPNVLDNSFDEESFNIVKMEEKNQIDRIKEDQRLISSLNALELFDSNSPVSYNMKGYITDLEKITRENLYDYYKNLINDSVIDIFVVGNIDFDNTEKIIKKVFTFNNSKKKIDRIYLDYKKHEKKPNEKITRDKTNQAKLSICCTIEDMTKYERDYVLNLYNIILGGSADSKFFKNIREKYSLCYYIVSRARKVDNILTIASGINKENYTKTLILINKEMKDMTKGKFSDEDILKAKEYCLAGLKEIEDTQGQIIASYYAIDKLNSDSIEKRKEMILKVTKEEIIELSKKVFIDSIFLLGGGGK